MAGASGRGKSLKDLRAKQGAEMDANEAKGLDFVRPAAKARAMCRSRLRPLLSEVQGPTIFLTRKGVLRALYALATGWDMTSDPRQKLFDGRAHRFHIATDAPRLSMSSTSHWRRRRERACPLLRAASAWDRPSEARGNLGGGNGGGRARCHSRLWRPSGREVRFNAVKVAQLPPATIANENFTSSSTKMRGRWTKPGGRRAGQPSSAFTPASILTWSCSSSFRSAGGSSPSSSSRSSRRSTPPRIGRSSQARCAISSSRRRPAARRRPLRRCRRYFDAVFVHGDAALIPFGTTFEAAGQIADLIQHTGYVAAAADNTISTEGKDRWSSPPAGAPSAPPCCHGVGGASADAALRPRVALPDRAEPFRCGFSQA